MPAKEPRPEIFRQAVEEADIAISITDTAANILYVNPAFCRITGYSADDLVGKNQSILSNKTTPPELYTALWQSITAGEPWGGRLVNLRKDRHKYLAEVAISPVHDEVGRIVSYLGLHRDMTEIHQLECQVRNQKALIESVVDGAPVALALIDEENHIVLDNQAHKLLMSDLGMAEPAVQLLAAIRSELGDSFRFPECGSLAGKSAGVKAFSEREVRIDRPGLLPTRWFSCSGVWVSEADDQATAFFTGKSHTYLLLVANDITGARIQQQRLQMSMLQTSMAEEDRINDLRESLSAAVFQLEGPLNMIASAVGVLQRREAIDAISDPMSLALSEAVKSGEEAILRLREMIPPQNLEAETPLNINELLREVIDLSTGRLLGAGISISWEPQSVLPAVNGHANKLRTMFRALLDNAIDAMNTRGWRERELRIQTRLLGECVEVQLEDSGPGIPPELQLKVFEPFFTTRKTGGRHLGTGLSSAQQVVMDHCGSIEIDRTVSKGCCVRVSLPLRHKEAV